MKHGNKFKSESSYTDFINYTAEPGYYVSTNDTEVYYDYIDELIHVYSDNTVIYTYEYDENDMCKVSLTFLLNDFTSTNIGYFVVKGNRILSKRTDTEYDSLITQYNEALTLGSFQRQAFYITQAFSYEAKLTPIETVTGYAAGKFTNRYKNLIQDSYTSYTVDGTKQYSLPILPNFYEIKRDSNMTFPVRYVQLLLFLYQTTGNKVNYIKDNYKLNHNLIKIN